jgi:hypothetical protein
MPNKFDFISPDILLREVDQSQVPVETSDDGVLIIGQSIAGPAMKPVKVKNLDELYTVFGRPQSGQGNITDIWREGNTKLPTYGLYAAQAWLASETSPVTFVRLLGEDQASAKQAGGYVKAGWNLSHTLGATIASVNTAYGLFVAPSASSGAITGSLAAVIYTKGAALALSGTIAGTSNTTASAGVMVVSDGTSQAVANTYKLEIHTDTGVSTSKTFHLDPNNLDGYIRNVLNCNPQKLVSTNQASTEKYFLGETFETDVKEVTTDISGAAGKQFAILLPLASGSAHWVNQNREATASKTGWFINRNPNPKTGHSGYNFLNADKLFKLVSLHEGEWFQKNYAAVISDLKLGTTSSPDSTFTLQIQDIASDIVVEQFTNCNLNQNSEDFIAKKVGNQFQTWDQTNNKYILKGEYPNRSDYVYVELSDALKAGLSDTYALPFGFYGPARPVGFALKKESSGPQTYGDVSGTKAKNVIANPSSPTGHTKALTITIGGVLKLTVSFDTGVAYDATPTLVGTTHTLGVDSTPTTTQIYASLAHLLNQLDNASAVADGATSVTITADLAEDTIYNIVVAGNYITDGHATATATAGAGSNSTHAFVANSKTSDVALGHTSGDAFVQMELSELSASYKFPTFRLTEQNTKGSSSRNYKFADLFGVKQTFDNESDETSMYANKDYFDIARALPAGLDIHTANGTSTEVAFVFSLDEIVETSSGKFYYSSGSHSATNSVTANSGSENLLVTQKVKQFRAPFMGGFDGVDVTLTDPFSSIIALAGKSETTSYAYYSVDKVLDLVSDEELVSYDVISMPGLINSSLQRELLNNTADRGDALAIVDLDGGYKAKHENSGTEVIPLVSTVVAAAKTADYNTSYGATYYPPVRLGASENVVVPSSVAGVGVLAQSDAQSGAPWFAPAGFNRGGLGTLGGSQGPKVSQAVENLNKADRDDLYQVNINPIANFPAEGPVVFGQKTLQQTPSALDRINVRRLMVFLKKRIGAVARTILFDNNVSATWNRFKAQAEPILADAKSRFGLAEYKLVLDESTTTPDYIDRNIMYAKVFIKPAYAIEFIAIDFNITRSGIEF